MKFSHEYDSTPSRCGGRPLWGVLEVPWTVQDREREPGQQEKQDGGNLVHLQSHEVPGRQSAGGTKGIQDVAE